MFENIVVIDRSGKPLPQQIYRAISDAVSDGRVPSGMRLPSSRQLADDLSVSRNSVNAAYELLRADGVIAIRPGAAPSVSGPAQFDTARSPDTPRTVPTLSHRGEALAVNLRGKRRHRATELEPGAPDEALFPSDLWARTLRRVARRRYGADAIYENIEGLPRLRTALAGHLHRQRGVVAKPEQILIIPSIQAGLTLAAQCLSAQGQTALVESPGYFGARTAFAGAGLDILPLETDDDGADPSAIGAADPRLIYVTPSHHYPTGARMPLQRRLDLLAAARQSGAIVFEDDYDSEFLWHGRAIAALQGIAGGNEVIYFGTTAKSLLPGLRLAHMVVPELLAMPLAQAQRNMGLRVNLHAQAAYAEMIETGALATHLNRIAKHYEARGRLLVETLGKAFGDTMAIAMPMGGLQTVARLADGFDDRAISDALAKDGFDTPALSTYCTGIKRSGLIIGFADATPDRLARFSASLDRVLRLT